MIHLLFYSFRPHIFFILSLFLHFVYFLFQFLLRASYSFGLSFHMPLICRRAFIWKILLYRRRCQTWPCGELVVFYCFHQGPFLVGRKGIDVSTLSVLLLVSFDIRLLHTLCLFLLSDMANVLGVCPTGEIRPTVLLLPLSAPSILAYVRIILNNICHYTALHILHHTGLILKLGKYVPVLVLCVLLLLPLVAMACPVYMCV